MLPSLSPLSDISAAGGAIHVPAPPGFRPIQGRVRNARLQLRGASPPPGPPSLQTQAQKAGLRYERQVHEHLSGLWKSYEVSPSFSFTDDRGLQRRCIPDGVAWLSDRDAVIIFEIKHQHCPEAWWQLRKLYEPVMRAHLENPFTQIILVEVVKTFDPSTPFPETVYFITDLLKHVEADRASERFGVWRWRK